MLYVNLNGVVDVVDRDRIHLFDIDCGIRKPCLRSFFFFFFLSYYFVSPW